MDLSTKYDAKVKLPCTLVDLFMECVITINYFINHKGKELGPIQPERGLRQDDPISPYPFILCVEGLSCFLNDIELKGLIHRPKIYSPHGFNYLAFVFCR